MSGLKSIAIIGVGHLATFLVKGLRLSGYEGEIRLSPRNEEKSAALAQSHGCLVAADNSAAAKGAEAVIFATRPAQLEAVIAAVALREDQLAISLAAGLPAEKLALLAAPAKLVTAMPISAVERCESPTILFPDDPKARLLFARLGQVIVLDSSVAFAAASANAALYGWLFTLMADLAAENRALGLSDEQAHRIVTGMLRAASGVAQDLPASELDGFVARLATPGGITEQGLKVLESAKAEDAWREALRKVALRLADGKG